MIELLIKLFNAVAEHSNSDGTEDLRVYARKYVEDDKEAELLVLFSYWFNDIEAVAAHYGIGLAKQLADGSLVYPDGTLDTYLLEGQVVVVNIPKAPTPQHWWYAGRWNEPLNDGGDYVPDWTHIQR